MRACVLATNSQYLNESASWGDMAVDDDFIIKILPRESQRKKSTSVGSSCSVIELLPLNAHHTKVPYADRRSQALLQTEPDA